MLHIQTNDGKVYKVTDANEIIRTDMPFTPSGQWLFIGLEGRRSYSDFIRADTLRFMLDKGSLPPLLYKNGNPRFSVRDNDHGTYRTWGGMLGGKPRGVSRVWLAD